MADQLKGQDAFAFDVLSQICKIDSEFMKDAADQMKATFSGLKQGIAIFGKEFPDQKALDIARISQAEEDFA